VETAGLTAAPVAPVVLMAGPTAALTVVRTAAQTVALTVVPMVARTAVPAAEHLG
jgi:hypothetical protein